MKQSSLYNPVKFFVITYAITFLSWSLAIYTSTLENGESVFILFLIPGMLAPFAAALWMILTSKSPQLKQLFVRRLFNLRLIRPISIFPMILIMPVAILLAGLISLLFGQSSAQFQLAEGFSFSVSVVPSLVVLILAAMFEELGWRGYALDSLQANHTYFNATLIFAVLWAGWHLPLFFINHTYQNEIARQNILFAVNFMVAILPMAFIIGWVWKLNRGSIPAAILFHFFTNMCQEALQITQVTKCIETVVLFLIAAVIVYLNQPMFFEKSNEAIA
jgi:membrane protease YdiL (CAAX protease family)